MRRKLLFERTDVRIQGTVSLETGRDTIYEFELLSDSYRETANRAVEALATDAAFLNRGYGSASFRAFPVIFLYRQALELILKAIIVAGAPAIECERRDIDVGTEYKHHSFERLRPLVELILETTGFGWNFGVPHLRSLEEFRKVLAEFDEFDPTSTLCRYPVDGAGNASFDEARCFNLFTFADTMDSILEALSVAPGAISASVEQYLSYIAE